MRFAALVSSSRASSLQILFCPAREVTGQTSLLDRAPNSLSLSRTHAHSFRFVRHVQTRVRIIRVCETYACPIRGLLVASWRCCSSSTTRPVIGYRPRPTRSTLNSIFSLSISLYLPLKCVPRTRKFTAPLLSTIVKDVVENGRSPSGCFFNVQHVWGGWVV